jgi:hypothetical protein
MGKNLFRAWGQRRIRERIQSFLEVAGIGCRTLREGCGFSFFKATPQNLEFKMESLRGTCAEFATKTRTLEIRKGAAPTLRSGTIFHGLIL